MTGLADVKGQSIRVNNLVEAEALRMLGATPVLLPVSAVRAAIASPAAPLA